jgi:uncharacterized protein
MTEEADNTAVPRPTFFTPWLFFVFAFCWSWFFWIWAALGGISVLTTLGKVLLLLGLLGPMLGGVCCAYLTPKKDYRREYWVRVIDPSRVYARWWSVIFLFVPAAMTMAALLAFASGDSVIPEIGKRLAKTLADPYTTISFALGVFMKGPLPEELGWRGYALDQLQTRWSALASSLILGVLWAAWHLPLFFMKGMYHHDQGLWSAGFWLFMAGVFPTAIVFTWIFNNTNRSTLAAIIFHFVANVSYELGNVSDLTNLYATLIWFLSAMIIVALWGRRTLTCDPDRKRELRA